MAEPIIDKKALEHLAALSRLEFSPAEEEKLLRDLQSILGYVSELRSVDTENVQPMSGVANSRNVFREDADRESTNRGSDTRAFPQSKDGFLKVPPVFE